MRGWCDHGPTAVLDRLVHRAEPALLRQVGDRPVPRGSGHGPPRPAMEQACPAGAEDVIGNTTVIADGGYRGTGPLIPNESLRLHGVQDELAERSRRSGLATRRAAARRRAIARTPLAAPGTERFTPAVAQLSDTSMVVCLGGIYALERIMRVSSKDQRSIGGVLSAYIRVHGAKVKANWSCGLFTNATMEEAYFSPAGPLGHQAFACLHLRRRSFERQSVPEHRSMTWGSAGRTSLRPVVPGSDPGGAAGSSVP